MTFSKLSVFSVCWSFVLLSLPMLAIDENSNGMSDVWEARYAAGALVGDGDEDGDGENNLDESLAGTNPFKAQDSLGLKSSAIYNGAYVVEWVGKPDMKYSFQIQDEISGKWLGFGPVYEGTGKRKLTCFRRANIADAKIQMVSDYTFLKEAYASVKRVDTDGDGLTDLGEYLLEKDPLLEDNDFGVISKGQMDVIPIRWKSKEWKYYRIETKGLTDAQWSVHTDKLRGDGGEMLYCLPIEEGQGKMFRVRVYDEDSDSNGLNDWEEHLLGLDPLHDFSNHDGQNDIQLYKTKAGETSKVRLLVGEPRSDSRRKLAGSVVLERTAGLSTVEVGLGWSGSALNYLNLEDLPDTIVLPYGQKKVDLQLPLIPETALSCRLYVHVEAVSGGLLDVSEDLFINYRNENLISVKDYGAAGNGVTDDTAALQAALDALAADETYNGLFFPTGSYRLTSYFFDATTGSGLYKILELEGEGLKGRDLIIRGEQMSEIYSDVSPVRAHMLVVRGSFRSLRFEDMTWRQSSVPLTAMKYSPNGSNGVSLTPSGFHEVHSVKFYNCVFDNCHGAVWAHGKTLGYRGKLNELEMQNCQVLNRYGANTEDSLQAWGGGQQVNIAPWVNKMRVTGCYFDGGSDLTDSSSAPGGRVKDNSYLGCALQLVFKENVVKGMGVEAVLQANNNTYMGVTVDGVEMPPEDGVTAAQVQIATDGAGFEIGTVFNLRTPLIPGWQPQNNVLEVKDYNQATKMLTFVSLPGYGNLPGGTSLTKGRTLYRDMYAEPTHAYIIDNLIDGTLAEGGVGFPEKSGVVINARSLVKNNVILNNARGVTNYKEPHTPRFPASRYSVIRDNIIVVEAYEENQSVIHYGILSEGPDDHIYNNYIVTKSSERVAGVGLRGSGTWVVKNRIVAEEKVVNGYTSFKRAIGIGNAGGSFRPTHVKNYTSGFDVGVGPLQAFQLIPYMVEDHQSYLDEVDIDATGKIDTW